MKLKRKKSRFKVGNWKSQDSKKTNQMTFYFKSNHQHSKLAQTPTAKSKRGNCFFFCCCPVQEGVPTGTGSSSFSLLGDCHWLSCRQLKLIKPVCFFKTTQVKQRPFSHVEDYYWVYLSFIKTAACSPPPLSMESLEYTIANQGSLWFKFSNYAP